MEIQRAGLVEQFHRVDQKGEVISSSKIRDLVKEGEVTKAASLLGRRHFVRGQVVEGEKLGRKLGFPTANLSQVAQLCPRGGVFLVEVKRNNKNHWGVVNIGVRPSVTNSLTQTIECHIMDFATNIYGEELKVSFVRKLRDEKKFSSLNLLREQIHKDLERANMFIDQENLNFES